MVTLPSRSAKYSSLSVLSARLATEDKQVANPAERSDVCLTDRTTGLSGGGRSRPTSTNRVQRSRAREYLAHRFSSSSVFFKSSFVVLTKSLTASLNDNGLSDSRLSLCLFGDFFGCLLIYSPISFACILPPR